jgi:TPR repeat protein
MDEAVAWFRKAVDRGCARGLFDIGLICERQARATSDGDAASAWLEKAFVWFHQAAMAGEVQAMIECGGRLAAGLGVEKDAVAGAAWFAKAARKGSVASMGYLLGAPLAVIEQVIGVEERSDWMRIAIEAGDAHAMHVMGTNLARGQGMPQDDREAVRWFQKAAEKGYGGAMAELGWCLTTGRGVGAEVPEGVRWIRRAAELGDAGAAWYLGELSSRGVVPGGMEGAASWYRKAAEAGHFKGMLSLSRCLAAGAGVAKDPDGALRWRRKAREAQREPGRWIFK